MVDNVAAPFKLLPRVSMEKRFSIIDKFAKDLRRLSIYHDCSILAINQFTKKMRLDTETDGHPQFHFVPFLGQTWRNNVDTSITLAGNEFSGR